MRRRSFLTLLGCSGPAWAQARRSSTLAERPPRGAVRLFDGAGLDRWTTRAGTPAAWRLERRYMEVSPGAGDILTNDRFADFQLHLEFWLPLLPQASGQSRANSGVYLQGRYEIQVLDSFEHAPSLDSCGAIYGQAAPSRNASRPPERWQTYDIVFRAPRDGERARVTVWHNGVAIHNNVEIAGPTGGAIDDDVLFARPALAAGSRRPRAVPECVGATGLNQGRNPTQPGPAPPHPLRPPQHFARTAAIGRTDDPVPLHHVEHPRRAAVAQPQPALQRRRRRLAHFAHHPHRVL